MADSKFTELKTAIRQAELQREIADLPSNPKALRTLITILSEEGSANLKTDTGFGYLRAITSITKTLEDVPPRLWGNATREIDYVLDFANKDPWLAPEELIVLRDTAAALIKEITRQAGLAMRTAGMLAHGVARFGESLLERGAGAQNIFVRMGAKLALSALERRRTTKEVGKKFARSRAGALSTISSYRTAFSPLSGAPFGEAGMPRSAAPTASSGEPSQLNLPLQIEAEQLSELKKINKTLVQQIRVAENIDEENDKQRAVEQSRAGFITTETNLEKKITAPAQILTRTAEKAEGVFGSLISAALSAAAALAPLAEGLLAIGAGLTAIYTIWKSTDRVLEWLGKQLGFTPSGSAKTYGRGAVATGAVAGLNAADRGVQTAKSALSSTISKWSSGATAALRGASTAPTVTPVVPPTPTPTQLKLPLTSTSANKLTPKQLTGMTMGAYKKNAEFLEFKETLPGGLKTPHQDAVRLFKQYVIGRASGATGATAAAQTESTAASEISAAANATKTTGAATKVGMLGRLGRIIGPSFGLLNIGTGVYDLYNAYQEGMSMHSVLKGLSGALGIAAGGLMFTGVGAPAAAALGVGALATGLLADYLSTKSTTDEDTSPNRVSNSAAGAGPTPASLTDAQMNALLDEQQNMEGWSSKSRSYKNNNPGNIKYGDFAKRHGAIGSDGQFAIFRSYQEGRNAQRALWLSEDYRNKPLQAGISRWAPDASTSYRQSLMSSVSGTKFAPPSSPSRTSTLPPMAPTISHSRNAAPVSTLTGALTSQGQNVMVMNAQTMAPIVNVQGGGSTVVPMPIRTEPLENTLLAITRLNYV